MNHAIRNLALASIAGVLISLTSIAYVTHRVDPRILLAGWTYYGFPFPIYGKYFADLQGTSDHFFIFNALGDFLIWFGISFALISILDDTLTRTHITLDATGGEITR
jgi:hypothetical protein